MHEAYYGVREAHVGDTLILGKDHRFRHEGQHPKSETRIMSGTGLIVIDPDGTRHQATYHQANRKSRHDFIVFDDDLATGHEIPSLPIRLKVKVDTLPHSGVLHDLADANSD